MQEKMVRIITHIDFPFVPKEEFADFPKEPPPNIADPEICPICERIFSKEQMEKHLAECAPMDF